MREAVRAANAEFYRAFESLSIEAMDQVWSHGPDSCCIHPGWQALTGWEAVRKSWQAIFQATSYMEFNLSNVQIWCSDDLGVVFCHENIVAFRKGQKQSSLVLATNIFQNEGGRWLMVLHHGSPVLTETGKLTET